MNLYEIILHEMCTDDSASSGFISENLKDTYANASPEARALIDDIFISLTGWSFATLLTKERAQEADEADVL